MSNFIIELRKFDKKKKIAVLKKPKDRLKTLFISGMIATRYAVPRIPIVNQLQISRQEK